MSFGALGRMLAKCTQLLGGESWVADEIVYALGRLQHRGWLKCNIDASHSVEDESIGFAAVVRDLYGHVIRGFIGWMEGLVKPLLAEAIAIWESLSWLKTLYMDRVVVESDCLRIIEALPISHNIDSEFSRILHGCSQLRSSFGFLSFCWTYRDAYKAPCHVRDHTGDHPRSSSANPQGTILEIVSNTHHLAKIVSKVGPHVETSRQLENIEDNINADSNLWFLLPLRRVGLYLGQGMISVDLDYHETKVGRIVMELLYVCYIEDFTIRQRERTEKINEEQRTKHEARRKDPAPVSINGDGEGDGASSVSSAVTTLDERSATAKKTYKNALMMLRCAILD
ncbi:hypothetical protein Gotri_020857 [Gossypium trilobum]|uniref:RNase H type-1 domain-containing protein n=1 Tax=Gossypium trilobum TaxID=34281 RepID=A0A7J9DAV1_9ROSI|nr:hypothetical protein [Gossypium trilobum]